MAQVERFEVSEWWTVRTPTMQCPCILTWGFLNSTIKPVNTPMGQLRFTYPSEQKNILCFLLSWLFINLPNRHFLCAHPLFSRTHCKFPYELTSPSLCVLASSRQLSHISLPFSSQKLHFLVYKHSYFSYPSGFCPHHSSQIVSGFVTFDIFG